MRRNRQVELRVGIFVIVALAIATTLVFVVGNQSNLFRSKSSYYALFKDVSGLRAGSPIRVSGVSVGSVSRVDFAADGRVEVELRVVEEARHLIREGAVAAIGTKGMLGDKLVDVSLGAGKPLAPGSTIAAEESADLGAYMNTAGRILADVEATMANLRRASEPLGEPEFVEAVRSATKNVAEVSRMLADGNGVIQKLATDPEMAQSVEATLTNLRVASGEIASASKSVRSITDEIRTGEGMVHELIYGQEGVELVRNFSRAAGEVATMLETVRQGDGALHDILYEEEGKKLLANLTATSDNLRQITEDVRAGRGTIGALIADPSIYEDVKRLVGDLQRNEVLRALVRYSIRRDEAVEAPRVESR